MSKEIYIRKSEVYKVKCIQVQEIITNYGFLGLKKKIEKTKAVIFIYLKGSSDPYYFTFSTDKEMEVMKKKILDSLENKSDNLLFSKITTV